jgi:PIF1 helicase.
MHMQDNIIESLTNSIYSDIADGHKPDEYFSNRIILSLKNDAVNDLNKSILNAFPDEKTILISIDKVTEGEDIYSLKYLHSLNATGLPISHLALKPGCPLMLFCNIDSSQGLFNGTHDLDRYKITYVAMPYLGWRICRKCHLYFQNEY